jgi:ABC-type polysaccharide/polyol phosphate export permease
VLYPLSFFDGRSFRQVLLLNPMTWLIDSYQRIWHANAWPDGGYLLLATTAALATLALGAITFARLQRRFAEEV